VDVTIGKLGRQKNDATRRKQGCELLHHLPGIRPSRLLNLLRPRPGQLAILQIADKVAFFSQQQINAMKTQSTIKNGRTVIPANLRETLDIKDDDQMIWTARDGELVATTRRAQLLKAQALFQTFVPKNSPSLADELIAERRAASDAE
jgi:bifunctional DNA-binding transcriptional regulator/antitoxin component of YhaV-PrlF toxin-antitoxin module